MKSQPKHMGLGVALGVALGAVAGVLAGNVGLWLSIGMAIGVAIGVTWRRKETQCPDCARIHRVHESGRLMS